tara:strand:+ start:560 stop:1246 length:687 start_codon:yes stop_codon:yes gene_type:complete
MGKKIITYTQFRFISVLLIFIIGFVYVSSNTIQNENFENNYKCYSLLFLKNNDIFLYNYNYDLSYNNPKKFDSMNDYLFYIRKINKVNNMKCPILELLDINDISNNPNVIDVNNYIHANYDIYYKNQDKTNENSKNKHIESNIFDYKQTNDGYKKNVYNKNMYPSFDKYNQSIGEKTSLDKIFVSDSNISANPMDTNWGGHKYTNKLIKDNYFKDRYIISNNKNNNIN